MGGRVSRSRESRDQNKATRTRSRGLAVDGLLVVGVRQFDVICVVAQHVRGRRRQVDVVGDALGQVRETTAAGRGEMGA